MAREGVEDSHSLDRRAIVLSSAKKKIVCTSEYPRDEQNVSPIVAVRRRSQDYHFLLWRRRLAGEDSE